MQERQQIKAIIFSNTSVSYAANKPQFKMLSKIHQQLQGMLGEHSVLKRQKGGRKSHLPGSVRWKGIAVSDVIIVNDGR